MSTKPLSRLSATILETLFGRDVYKTSPVYRSTQPISGELLTLSQNLEKADDGLDAAIEIRDVEFLVRGMQIVVGKTHPHPDARNVEVVLKLSDNGDGTTGADVNRVLAKDLVHGGNRGACKVVVGRDDAGRPLAVYLNAGRDAFGRDLGDVVGELLEDVVGVLIGHQAH